MSNLRGVYLIHIHGKIGGHAQHYIGKAEDLDTRIAQHRETTWERFTEPRTIVNWKGETRPKAGERHGPGATLLGVANSEGFPWELARVWLDDDPDAREKRIKGTNHLNYYCPICKGRGAKLDA